VLFTITLTDGPEGQTIRREKLAEHLAFVEASMARIRVAGPQSSSGGAGYDGSLYVIEAENLDDAQAFLAGDPYFGAGVWASHEIRAFQAVAGEWVGGRTW
jgi:uncharacterized protein YciI